MELLNSIDWNSGIFELSIEGLSKDQFTSNFTVRKGDVILDLNFTMDITTENIPLTIKPVPDKRLVKTDEKTGDGLMILREFTATTGITHADTSHDYSNELKVIKLARVLNIMNYVIFGTILIMTIVFLAYNIDFSSFLIDYVRVAKLLHRIGFVQVKFPFLI